MERAEQLGLGGRIQLLDCTIRDGGYSIKEYKLDSFFDGEVIKRVITDLSRSGINIIEAGLLEGTELKDIRYGVFGTVEELSRMIPQEFRGQRMYSAMIRNIDIAEEEIPVHSEELCDAIRVVIRYSEINKSLDLCEKLIAKGYKVFIQPAVTMRYTAEELKNLVMAANHMGAYALYIVDSYGCMDAGDIQNIFEQYDAALDKNIKIGFHGHNNMTMAYANAQFFADIQTEREIIIDSCLQGMGQGGGNLQTELFLTYANRVLNGTYDLNAVLDGCEEIAKYNPHSGWGYSMEKFLAALYKTAYKYADALREEYALTYSEINSVLRDMPSHMRHRCTKENVKYIYENFR